MVIEQHFFLTGINKLCKLAFPMPILSPNWKQLWWDINIMKLLKSSTSHGLDMSRLDATFSRQKGWQKGWHHLSKVEVADQILCVCDMTLPPQSSTVSTRFQASIGIIKVSFYYYLLRPYILQNHVPFCPLFLVEWFY